MNIKRRGISPVLATVILIAITLVAGVAIAGFAFGLFNNLQNTANLQVTSSVCDTAGCTLTLSNSGAGIGTLTGASSGFSLTGAPVTVPPNTATQTVTLTGTLVSGQTITGYLTQNGGASLYFTATVS